MQLEGCCHCGLVRFRVESQAPWPYLRCYCSVCRKTAGAGGYAINLGADARSLRVEGQEHVKVYRALVERGGKPEPSEHERHFCGACGSHLWAFNPRWPKLVHPVAGAVDTPLPVPPEGVHIMLASKPSWVAEPRAHQARFAGYPEESLAAFHARHGFGKSPSSSHR